MIKFLQHLYINKCNTRQASFSPHYRGILPVVMIAMMNIVIPEANAQFFGTLPPCSEAKVLDKIVSRFNKTDEELWYSGARIISVGNTAEKNYNIYPDSQINRRYCHGRAYMADGKYRRVHFLIEQGMGLAGFGWGVEYCLKGSDLWYAYGGWCRVLRK